jgi:alpha-ribazole phosphatase
MTSVAEAPALVYAWRHPRPLGAEGRCIGARTDLPVDPRRAKRLAHRIRRVARSKGLPRLVATSPLQRCAAVGRWLKRWGWTHRIDADLVEVDFGAWDGQHWPTIAVTEIDAWCADFHCYAPGGGEPLERLLQRAAAWQSDGAQLVVTHGGWLLARRWQQDHPDGREPRAADWPPAPRYGEFVMLNFAATGNAPAEP